MIGSCWGSTQSAEPVASWWAVPAAADGSGAGRGSRKRRVGGISVENPSEGFPGGVFFTTRRPQAVKRRRGGMFEAVPRPGGPVMRSATMRVSALAVLLATGAAVLRRRRSMNRTASTARTPVARRDRIERSHVARADSDRTHGTAVRVARARGADLGAETPRGRGGEEGRASVRARDLGPTYLSSDGRILRSDARHLRLISGFLETVWSNVRRKVNQ